MVACLGCSLCCCGYFRPLCIVLALFSTSCQSRLTTASLFMQSLLCHARIRGQDACLRPANISIIPANGMFQVIGEDSKGLIDMRQLELELLKHANAPLIVGSFTAGSNVTGIAPDVHSIANLLHRHGAIAAFDYASAGSSKQVPSQALKFIHWASLFYCLRHAG